MNLLYICPEFNPKRISALLKWEEPKALKFNFYIIIYNETVCAVSYFYAFHDDDLEFGAITIPIFAT